MISNNSGIRTRKRLITILEIVMIHILSMAMLKINEIFYVYQWEQLDLPISYVEDAFTIEAIEPP